MALTKKQQEKALEKQVEGWLKEMSRLANLVAAAKGSQHCALIMVRETDEDCADVIPELILEDVLRVNPHGWPEGFEIELLNPTST